MKKLLLFAMLLPMVVAAQFHVNIEANPANKGEVNPEWKNNYVVTYTKDNWKTKTIIKGQVTYRGVCDNGYNYSRSFFEEVTFQNKQQAAEFARLFRKVADVNKYESTEQVEHNKLKAKFDAEYKTGCKTNTVPNEKPKPIKVY